MAERNDSWYHLAACRGMATAWFFPDRAYPDPEAVAEVKAVCERCPVRARCLATGRQEMHGIWGGLTVRERRAASRAHQEAAA
jgi:WhiB family redox-sensing transcriptional regulator